MKQKFTTRNNENHFTTRSGKVIGRNINKNEKVEEEILREEFEKE